MSGQWATILIDFGSTHNFVNTTAVRRFGLLIEIGTDVKVLVANGDQLSNEGLWQNIKLCIQGYSFETNLFVINLVGCDVAMEV